MARRAAKKTKTQDTDNEVVEVDINDVIDDLFGELEDINPDAAFLDDHALSVVRSFIDTGSYTLNGIISGSLHKGIPSGRIVGFVGPSGCGKTQMILRTVANAQKQGRFAAIWDSENAVDMSTAKNLGCDVSRIKHYPIDTIENCRNQIVKFLNHIIANPALKGKFIIAIDSLGNLSTIKELDDAASGHNAADMGLRAKLLKGLLRAITYKAAKADCPVLFANHIYGDPKAMYESIKKAQSGGSGPEYMASVVVQLVAKGSRTKDEEVLAVAKTATGGQVSGVTMRALTTKNRLIPPFLECEIDVNFKTGIKRFAGLVPLAKALGILEGTNSYAFAKGPWAGTKVGRENTWGEQPEVWKVLLETIESHILETFRYSESNGLEDDDVLAQSIQQLSNQDE